MEIPEKFNEYLGSYGPVSYDSHCGEPIIWGYPIVRHLGESLWSELNQFASLKYTGNGWAVVTKTLTRQEAIEKYGPETEVERGPRGGFRSIQFGTKRFLMKELLSDGKNE